MSSNHSETDPSTGPSHTNSNAATSRPNETTTEPGNPVVSSLERQNVYQQSEWDQIAASTGTSWCAQEEINDRQSRGESLETMESLSESVSIQEQGPDSFSVIVTGTEEPGATHLKLPPELELPLQENVEEFKCKVVNKFKDIVCTQSCLDPLKSVPETVSSGGNYMQNITLIISLALTAMRKQMNIVKQWYRHHPQKEQQEPEQHELPRAVGELHARQGQPDLMQQSPSHSEEKQPTSDTDPGSPAPSLAQNTQGYVRVEHEKKPTNAEDGDVKLRVEEASQRESELERKIGKLKTTQKQLVEANTEWEKHCREITEQHEKQLKAQSEELRETTRRYREQRDKVKECESEITQLKSHLAEVTEQERLKWSEHIEELNRDFEEKISQMSEDLARKEAAFQSLRERHPSNEHPIHLRRSATGLQSTETKSDLEKRVHELELQVQHLMQERTAPTPMLNLNTENRQHRHTGSPSRGESEQRPNPRSSPDQRNAQVKHYKTQISVLQAQITAFKEDFDNERADRERAQAQKDDLQQQCQRMSREIVELKQVIDQKDRESAAMRNQNDYVRQQYTQKCRELETERARVKENEAKVARLQTQVRMYQQQGESTQHRYTYSPTLTPPDVYISRPPTPGTPQWSCPHCTFLNIQQRVTCEMCGQRAPHIHGGGNIVADTPRLLARSVDQSDGNTRMEYRNRPKPCYQRDVMPDTQYMNDIN